MQIFVDIGQYSVQTLTAFAAYCYTALSRQVDIFLKESQQAGFGLYLVAEKLTFADGGKFAENPFCFGVFLISEIQLFWQIHLWIQVEMHRIQAEWD